MQSRLNPYINFKDDAREAMEFYHSVFGGKLDMNTFGEAKMSQDPAEANKIMHAMLAGAVCATIESIGRFHPVTDNPATTVGTGWCQRMDRAFEAVEHVCLTTHSHFETFVVGVAADLASGPCVAERVLICFHNYLFLGPFTSGRLCLFNVLTSRPSLGSRRFGTFRYIVPIFRFEAVAGQVSGSRAQFFEQVSSFFRVADQTTAFHMRVFLANQPSGRGPGTA